MIHAKGIWVEKDQTEAVKWFRMAAVTSRAKHNLATSYHQGHGVEKDTEEAARWYEMAAEQGFTASQIAIGLMYFTGDGVEQDEDEAEEWFRMATEQGDPPGVFDLDVIVRC